MKDLNRKAVFGILRLLIMLVLFIFLPAWTVHYWQGWACLFAFFAPAVAISVWVARKDPALLERRVKAGASAEKEPVQKVIQTIAAVAFGADFVVSSVDHRF